MPNGGPSDVAFTFKTEDENLTCICTTEKGFLRHPDTSLSKERTMSANQTCYWEYFKTVKKNFVDFVSIEVQEDGHIVGYAVIKITWSSSNSHNLHFIAENVSSNWFPEVDGEYQDITQDQIEKILKNARDLNKRVEKDLY